MDANAEHRLQTLIDRHFDETLTAEEAVELNGYLAASEAARELFWHSAHLHARLRQWGEQQFGQFRESRGRDGSSASRAPVLRFPAVGRFPLMAAAAALVLVGAVALWRWHAKDEAGERTVATFGPLEGVRWVGLDAPREGDAIRAGQRVEIAAGKVRIDFHGGAVVTLSGSAMFEATSEKEAFLALGRLAVKADTPAAHGFALRTRTARVVDLGTEFTAEAASDGQSLVEVRSGAIEVAARNKRHLLRTGDMLLVEPGAAQVVVRIERGDETPAFRFPTIEPPSEEDYADVRQGHARIAVVKGMLSPPHPEALRAKTGSGPAETLLDGRGQSGPDVPLESVFFKDETEGRLLLDLGSTVSVAKINTYSWHQNWLKTDNRLRAQQQYVLYGFAGANVPPVDGPLEATGWVPIARVDTDKFFAVDTRSSRPAQQACSITAATGMLGRYRYLLWDVKPSRFPDYRFLNHTFYGEFDVYTLP